MLCPETSTYPARPPSDSGRRKYAQKRQVSTTRAMLPALFVRSNAAPRLLLIVDHELRLVGRGLARVEDRLIERRRRASVADSPAEGRRGALDERIDVRGHGYGDGDIVRRPCREARRRGSIRQRQCRRERKVRRPGALHG